MKRRVRDAGVAGSNPATPTNISIPQHFHRFKARRSAVMCRGPDRGIDFDFPARRARSSMLRDKHEGVA